MAFSDDAHSSPAASPPRLLTTGLATADAPDNTSAHNLCLAHRLSPALLGPHLRPTSDTMEDEEEEAANEFRKVKMFEMAPSSDPQLEERRQRAVYAKRNRDMKKREGEKLQREVAALRTANEQCQASLVHMHGAMQDQQRKLDQLQQQLADTHCHLRDRDEQIRTSHKKLSHLKAHLELIADSLDENSMPRRLLLSLLAQT